MPKAARTRVAARGQIEVAGGGGNVGVPAAIRASAMGGTSRSSVIAPPDRSLYNGFTMMSGVLNQLARQVEIKRAKAEAEAERARAKSEAAAEKAAAKSEAEIKARQDSVDRISAAVAGNDFLTKIAEKSLTGEWGPGEAQEAALSILQGEGSTPTFSKAFESYAIKGMALAADNHGKLKREEETGAYLSVARQALHDLHANYDPEKFEEYAEARNTLFQDRKTLGISGDQINNLELASIVNQAKRFASTDPARAYMLMDLAEQVRPDGSPSLAASAVTGYSTLQALREEIADTVVREAHNERQEAQRTLQESTRDNYIDALTELSKLEGMEAVNAWAADNVDGLTQEQFKARFGDHRGDILNAVSRFRSGQKSDGNDAATAAWMESIQRGEADWEDVRQDDRLNDLQRQRLFASMRDMTQKAQLGYMPDATLAGKLLGDLEAAWPDSVYATPWMASRMIEPGKPPIITPEGLYYQGQLLKRLRTLDPDLDVISMNQKKMEILQDVKDDILSGKIRWRDQAVTVQEPYPELKLGQKIQEGERLSDANVANIAKAFNGGGVQQVWDSFGIDYFSLDGLEQKRVAAEAQRQKAELDALHADTFFGRITSGATDEALRVFSDQIMGMPVDIYDSDPEISGQRLGESVEREKAKLEDLESRLEEVKRAGQGLANLKTIMLERDVKRQREHYELLKGRHDAHMKSGKGKR